MQEQFYDYYFVFDVETVGLYGPPFALGYVVCDKDGIELESNGFWVNVFQPTTLQSYKQDWSFTDQDVKWVKENVLPAVRTSGENHLHERTTMNELLLQFWKLWEFAKKMYPKMVLAADCPYPVETSFIKQVLELRDAANMENSPYPFLDVASMLIARGLDPMADWQRYEEEKPIHNPLADARQSARLLMSVLGHTLRRNT